MKGPWLLLVLASLALGEEGKYRLSWGPYDFLEKGFRSAPWVRDPFFPEENAFVLSGIISSEMAYINGRWYRRGDKINGYDVKEINQTGVTLMRHGQVILLRMDDEP